MKRFSMMNMLAMLALAVALVPAHAGATGAHKAKSACKAPKRTTHVLRSAEAQPAITFGVSGGNMLPWSITVNGDGSVTGKSWMTYRNTQLVDPTNTLNALFKLADAEGFFSMPSTTPCAGTHPDVGSRYIEMDTASGSHRASVHGACVTNFNELFAALGNVVDIRH